MVKICFLGAGSTIFAKRLLSDILSFPELSEVSISLFDIDEERLTTSENVARKLAYETHTAASIFSTTNRREALDGANYAIGMFQVAGYKPGTVVDFDIPKKYGLRQTIADTLGIGGIMRALRTIPVLLDVCRDMEQVCPEVTFLNHINPMAMNCWAISRLSKIKTVGLCHSIQGTAEQLAQMLKVPIDELNYICAGINHMAFYLRLEHSGKDLYPLLRQVIAEKHIPADDRVRYEVLKRLGYFVTESSEHFSEYVPWFIKRDRADLIQDFNIPLDEYLQRCKDQIARWEIMRVELEKNHPLEVRRSREYTSLIIHSQETGQPRVIYGNVPNHGMIDNLPDGCCVEVPCLVDKNGIHPTHVGALPPHLSALIQTNINVQNLAVEAALTGKREHIYHAAMLDPHTAAELDLDQIWHLVDDLIAAHGKWLPVFDT